MRTLTILTLLAVLLLDSRGMGWIRDGRPVVLPENADRHHGGNRPIAKRAYKTVLAIYIKYSVWQNKKDPIDSSKFLVDSLGNFITELVEKISLCTGTVYNNACLVLAAHCLDDPDMLAPVTISVFSGPHANKQINDPVLYPPLATADLSTITTPEGYGPKIWGKDIAILRLNNQIPDDYSYFASLNLPTYELLASQVNKKAIIAGYGGVTSNYDEATGRWTDDIVGDGELRDGDVRITNVSEDSPIITVKGDPHVATPGDSGGPLLTTGLMGQDIQLGVLSNMNQPRLLSAFGNMYVSLAHYKMREAFKLPQLNCPDKHQLTRLPPIAEVGFERTPPFVEKIFGPPQQGPPPKRRISLEPYSRDPYYFRR